MLELLIAIEFINDPINEIEFSVEIVRITLIIQHPEKVSVTPVMVDDERDIDVNLIIPSKGTPIASSKKLNKI